MIEQLAEHPAAQLFPMIEGLAFEDLVADIKANGLREPLVRVWRDSGYGNKTRTPFLLDGRNRLRACAKARVRPEYEDFEGDDAAAYAYVLSKNLHRRHLTESQRAMVAARLAKGTHGGSRKPEQAAPVPLETQASAAAKLNVGERTVREAKAVIDRAAPELVAAVDVGDVTVKEATRLLDRPAEEQRAIVERLHADKAKGLVPSVKRATTSVAGPDLSQWFTDPLLARRMVALLGDIRGWRVLEPAAGSGNIVDALLEAGARVVAYELDESYVAELHERFAAAIAKGRLEVIAGNFLESDFASDSFDVSVQNPPFEDGLDGKFVEISMRACLRVVVLGRLAMLEGQDRYDRVWSRCQPGGEWAVRKLRVFPERPVFEAGRSVGARVDEGSSKTAFAIVKLTREDLDVAEGRLDLEWWKFDAAGAAKEAS